MSNQNQNQPNKPMFNRGFITREKGATNEGCSAKGNSLELWVVNAIQKTVPSTGEVILEMNTNGHFNSYNGIDYTLGKDVYADDSGLIWVTCSAWGVVKDRLIKLNMRKGYRLRIYGVFQKETYPRNDGTTGVKVVCKNVQNFEVVSWPKDENNNGQNNSDGNNVAPAPTAPATAPTPAPVNQTPVAAQPQPTQSPTPTVPVDNTTPTQTAPVTPTQNQAPTTQTPVAPSNTEVEVPF